MSRFNFQNQKFSPNQTVGFQQPSNFPKNMLLQNTNFSQNSNFSQNPNSQMSFYSPANRTPLQNYQAGMRPNIQPFGNISNPRQMLNNSNLAMQNINMLRLASPIRPSFPVVNQIRPLVYGGSKKNQSQKKKSYCSLCNLWMYGSYDNHLNSAEHNAKKNSQKINSPQIDETDKNKRKNSKKNRKIRNVTITPEVPKLQDVYSPSKPSSEMNSPKKSTSSTEVLISVSGIYCTLCEMFFPKTTKAELDHCSTSEHHQAYEKYRNQITQSLNESEEEIEDVSKCKIAKFDETAITPLKTVPIESVKSDNDKDFSKYIDFDEASFGELQCPEVSLDFPDEDQEDYIDKDFENY